MPQCDISWSFGMSNWDARDRKSLAGNPQLTATNALESAMRISALISAEEPSINSPNLPIWQPIPVLRDVKSQMNFLGNFKGNLVTRLRDLRN